MIRALQRLMRLVRITAVFIRHGLDEVILAIPPLRPVRFLLYLLPWNWVSVHQAPRAVRLRRALEELGPIFVKFGQILSTRRDLLPEDIAEELANLQDQVPPFPGQHARRIVEESLRRPVDEAFLSFEETPLASASIAQVHAATLLDGTEVVVKVLRPGVEATIKRDVALLYLVAMLAERYWGQGRRLRPMDVVGEYEATILDELDLLREAASASQLRRNFHDSELLKVPDVYWDYSSRRVMVMERISGIPISDVDRLCAAGIDLAELAERGVAIFFTQVMRHNFFHADMHPGNIFVAEDNPENPRYIAVDFGIMGSLAPEDQRYLAENFVAFFNRDYRRVAELHVMSGWVPSSTRVNDFEAAIRSVCEPIFERPLKDISFGNLLLRLFQTARRFHMQVQPQLFLLQKTLLNVEGLGRQLYPDLDLWKTAKPFLDQWMAEQMGPGRLAREVVRQAPKWSEILPSLPSIAFEVLQDARGGRLRVGLDENALGAVRREIRRANQRTVVSIVGATLTLGAVLLLVAGAPEPIVAGAPLLAWVAGPIGLWMLLWSALVRSESQ